MTEHPSRTGRAPPSGVLGGPLHQGVPCTRGGPAPAQVHSSITEDSGLGQAVPEGWPGDGHGPVLALGG